MIDGNNARMNQAGHVNVTESIWEHTSRGLSMRPTKRVRQHSRYSEE